MKEERRRDTRKGEKIQKGKEIGEERRQDEERMEERRGLPFHSTTVVSP